MTSVPAIPDRVGTAVRLTGRRAGQREPPRGCCGSPSSAWMSSGRLARAWAVARLTTRRSSTSRSIRMVLAVLSSSLSCSRVSFACCQPRQSVPEPVLDLVGVTAGRRLFPAGCGSLLIVRVEGVEPTEPDALLHREPREVHPTLVEVDVATVRAHDPDDLRHRLNQCAPVRRARRHGRRRSWLPLHSVAPG